MKKVEKNYLVLSLLNGKKMSIESFLHITMYDVNLNEIVERSTANLIVKETNIEVEFLQ